MFDYSKMLTNEPRVSSISLCAAATVLRDVGVVHASWEVGDHVEQMVLGVADCLHIDGVIVLVIWVRRWIWKGCLKSTAAMLRCWVGQQLYGVPW